MNRVGLAILAILLSAFGCTESSSTPSAKAAASPAQKAAETAPAVDVNVCGLLPAATVAQITGKQFSSAEEDDTRSYRLYACNYSAPQPTPLQLRISIVGKNGKIGYEASQDSLKKAGHKVTPVSGIGDAAYTSDGPWEILEVLYADTSIDLSGMSGVSVDQAKQMIAQLHEKMVAGGPSATKP